MKALKAELDTATDKTMTMDMFVATVRKYTRAKKLTQRMLNELVDYIEVYQAEKKNGVHSQKLKIYYNCVGDYITYRRFTRNSPQYIVYKDSA